MILGLDFDTRAVHAVLLDDDTDAARYVPIPIVDKRGSFEAARNVRAAMREGWFEVDDVWLVGIEDSMYRSPQTVRALARVQGAILASLPRDLCVVPLAQQEWKRETVGFGNAKKPDVELWALNELLPTIYECGARHWPQDAFDAYAIARAARSLNARGIAAA